MLLHVNVVCAPLVLYRITRSLLAMYVWIVDWKPIAAVQIIGPT